MSTEPTTAAVAAAPDSNHGFGHLKARLRAAALVLVLAWGLGFPLAGFAESEVAVLYPDVREPYRSVFLEIVNGVEEGLGASVAQYAVPDRLDPQGLSAWISSTSPKVVIALGTRALYAAKTLNPPDGGIIVGAVMSEPEGANGFSGISLTPDPHALFDRLRQLSPSVRQVSVIYSPHQNAWLIDLARDAAKARGLKLEAFPTRNLREAAATYREILRRAGPTDAIWLPQDPITVDEQAILSSILKEAWDRNVVVFSSNPAHVRRGALFSLFPDNSGLGRSLARMARERLYRPGAAQSGMTPLHDLLIAVNVRTAEHLGLSFSARELRRFDLVFPSP